MTNFLKTNEPGFSKGLVQSLLITLPFLICFSSCSITKTGNYFKNITRDTVINTLNNPVELKIKKGDVIDITISSLNRAEDEIYNATINKVTLNDAGVGSAAGFLVDEVGNIYIHKLGNVKAEGLTRKQLKSLLEKELLPYLRDPIVSVNFANHHITVIGEIGKPQILPLSQEQVSLIDVLAQSGTITQLTQLNNIMIIRETENSKVFKHVNLEDHSIFTSPYYYLQPNDVVVLNQNEKILKEQLKREKGQQYTQLIFQGISLALIIYQVFIRR